MIGCIASDDPNVAAITFVAYNVVVGMCCIGLFVQARYVEAHVIRILDASYASIQKKSILKVKVKLQRFQKTAKKQSGFQTVMSLCFAVVPYCWNLYPYFCPLTLTLPAFLFINAVKTMQKTIDKEDSKGSSRSFTFNKDTLDEDHGGRKYKRNKKGMWGEIVRMHRT